MRAAIVSIGDELALGQNVDTNSAWLSARLAEVGVMTAEHRTLADDRAALAATLGELLKSFEVVITTGGLGPTADDLTREALGDVLEPGESLIIDEAACHDLERWFRGRGRSMPEMNRKQALRPKSMRILANPHGTAPGLMREGTDATQPLIFALPGPPREMQPMFTDHVLPAISRRREQRGDADQAILTASVLEFGLGESVAAEKLGDMMDRVRNPLVGTTASDSIVAARVRASGPREWATRETERLVQDIHSRWFPYAFGENETTLVDAVAELLEQRKQTLTTAESCTGGWLAKVIVDRPGCSDCFAGGWVTYSNPMKQACLGVPAAVIAQHGAVSRETALAMARGALHRAGAHWALAVTGIAGPDGGSRDKPVGTVWIALACAADDGRSQARRFQFPGNRSTIRDRSVKAALQMLRFALLDVPTDTPLIWERPH